ncbi:MAG: efflux RND transporter periplasmic adaptor subunit, partial [Bacteroidales bacterium]|nr:efflux RND transporter periplasmic adaptor subunit [Bacteroidales bacterium]
QVSGIVEKLYVDFNSPVKKGQILAELDKTALRSSVQQSLATLDNAKAEMEYQASNYERSKALHEKNLIAQSDYDQAKYNYDRAKATLKNSQAQYDKALVQLGYATIYSPIEGVVMNRAVDEGQTVAASFNTPEIFTIAQDLTQMQVEADIDESDIGMINQGQRVEFDVDAYPEETFAGTVEQIRLSPVTTSGVVTYTVIINAPNPDQKLLPGMTANIIIYAEEKKDVLTIPYRAVKFTPEADYLAKVGKEMFPGGMGGGMPGGAGRSAGNYGGMGAGMAPGADAGAGSGSGGMTGGGMPEGFTLPEGFKMPTMVWVKDEKGIHPVWVEIGSNDGENAEVKSGLAEGDEVAIKMTVATSKDKKEKEVASNPFMPTPPGRRNSQGTSRSSAGSSTRN